MVVVLNRDQNLDIEENSLENVKTKMDPVVSKKNQSLPIKPLHKENKLTVNSIDIDKPKTPSEALNNINTLYSGVPISNELDNIHTIASVLSDKLKECAKTAEQDNSKGLANCLGNLVTYANRILKISSDEALKKDTGVGVNSAVIQTKGVDKCVQTVNKQLYSVEVQTENVRSPNQPTQTNELLLRLPEADENISQPHGSTLQLQRFAIAC